MVVLYLFVHFVHLTPWAAELFSNQGVLADRGASPLLYLFPNILAIWDGPIFVTPLHISLIVLIDFADLSLGMVMLHLFTFDSGWIPGAPAALE